MNHTRSVIGVLLSDLQARQSSSLDWRVGRSVTFGSNLHWSDATRSAEQLSRSAPLTSDHLQTPSTRYANSRASRVFFFAHTQQKRIIYDKLIRNGAAAVSHGRRVEKV